MSSSGRPTVSAVLVGWNSLRYLNACFKSLETQTLPPSEIIFVDNGSTDGTRTWLRQKHPEICLIQNSRNVGFCVANNQGIAAARGDYVLLLNTDVVLEPWFIEIVVGELEENAEFGWGSGKLLRLDPDDPDPTDPHEAVIDSTGEIILSSRRAINRGSDEIDEGQYDRREEVFGVTAAAAIYRRAMLDDLRLGGDWLDSDYFAYLEDCDLNWRARLRGWRCIYRPDAVAFHARNHPTRRDRRIRRRAHFNYWLNIVKNESLWNLLLAAPHIAVYELWRTLKTLFRQPDVLGGVFSTLALLPGALWKRGMIQRSRKTTAAAMRRWIVPESYVRHVARRCGVGKRRVPSRRPRVTIG